MNIKRFILGPLRSNCYVVSDINHALVIDPGDNPTDVLAYINEHNLIVDAIYITHGHPDHVGGVKAFKDEINAPVYAPIKDKEWMIDSPINRVGHVIPVDYYVHEHSEIHACGRTFTVFETPGHSEGSTALYYPGLLFSGDTLFYQSIGRTDIPKSDSKTIYFTIKKLYEQLPDETVVYPGHGIHTTIGHEKQFNPFVRIKL